MKIYKQITDIFVKIVSVILMCLIASLVGVMLYELSLRNFLNKSFRASTELCGFLFMWMAFLGVIVLYDQDRLITLDMLYVRATPKVQTGIGNHYDRRLSGYVQNQQHQLLFNHAVCVQSLAFPAHGHRGRLYRR